MVLGIKQRLSRFSVAGLALVMGGVGVGVPTLAADGQIDDPASGQLSCLLVDTDVGVDDFRALATLLPKRQPRAVVVTEGIAGVQRGMNAVSVFLASRGVTPPVLAGFASAGPPAYEWLPAARAGAERINNYLYTSVPSAGKPTELANRVGAAVTGCGRVDVLVLGPWTSYLKYASVLGTRANVIASGRPLAENNPDNFNCEYDLAACRMAAGLLRDARGSVFVDLPPAAPGSMYDPTESMIALFKQVGMPGLLRAALQVDPSQWLGTRLWDDAAALYLLSPTAFQFVGWHLEPAVSETTFRSMVVNAVNAG